MLKVYNPAEKANIAKEFIFSSANDFVSIKKSGSTRRKYDICT